ncbi:hypothetical protein [Collimonas sp. OK307]|uniref:hypothetical protein n=1 Tax=Collimonas sp. OK307 TaxID=1801620 RepID=UPI001587C18E|nr:hypothetical protein [Collimonas sp. OK307]
MPTGLVALFGPPQPVVVIFIQHLSSIITKQMMRERSSVGSFGKRMHHNKAGD